MSKAHDPHWRYIGLRLDGEQISRRSLQNAITGRGRKEGVPDDALPQLTRYQWPHAIVKVHHHATQAARQWLPRVTWAIDGGAKKPLQITPLKTSGTIKALTQRIGVLHGRGPRPAKPQSLQQRH